MRQIGKAIIWLLLFATAANAQEAMEPAIARFGAPASLATSAKTSDSLPPYDHSVPKGPHHRIRVSIESLTNEITKEVTFATNRVVELASGMHYLKDGAWTEAQELIELTEHGAVANQGALKVTFAPNLNVRESIALTTPDGKALKSTVLGISYYDAESGNSVLLGELKDSIGELLPPNQVVYKDAFDGIKADVRFTYKKGSFSQDVILLEAPPSPADFGLNPKTSRLEVLTEYFDPPAPKKTVRTLREEADLARRAEMEDPDFVDEELDFGSVQKGTGRAFSFQEVNDVSKPAIHVSKRWTTMEGRTVLIEGVEYAAAVPELEKLPETAGAIRRDALQRASSNRRLPDRPLASVTSSRQIVLALGPYRPRGFVVDPVTVYSTWNFTFSSGQVYDIIDEVNVEFTTFQANAVIRIHNGGFLRLGPYVTCPTSGYVYFMPAEEMSCGPLVNRVGIEVNNAVASSVLRRLHFSRFNHGMMISNPAGTTYVEECVFNDTQIGIHSFASHVNIATPTICNCASVITGSGNWSSTQHSPTVSCDDAPGTPANATTVAMNSTVSKAFDHPGDLDFFEVTMSAPGRLTVYTTGSADTYGYILNGSCGIVDEQGGGLNSNFRASVIVPQGKYYIAVRHQNLGAGAYTLHVTDDAPPTISPIPTQTIFPTTSTGPIPFTIADDRGAALLSLSVYVGGTVFAPPDVSLGGSGENRTLTVQSPSFAEGLGGVVVTVSDGVFATSTTCYVHVTSNHLSIPDVTYSSFNDNLTLNVQPTHPTEGVELWYSTSDPNPTRGAPALLHDNIPFHITQPVTVWVRAFKDGWLPSASRQIAISRTAQPSFSVPSHGEIHYVNGPMTVNISAAAGSTIKFKAGAAGTWQTGSTVLMDGLDSGRGSLTAYAFTSNALRSENAVAVYSFRLPQPTSSVTTDQNGAKVLALSSSVPGASIYYTVNGAVPSASSTLYTAPFAVNPDTRVLATAIKAKYINSGHVTAWVHKLPDARIADATGLVTADRIVNNDIDIWIVPNLGIANAYGEVDSTDAWNGPLSVSFDVPSSDSLRSFFSATSGNQSSKDRIPVSYGRTYSMRADFKRISGKTLAGIINRTSNNEIIQFEDYSESDIAVTSLETALEHGSQSAHVADSAAFSPLGLQAHLNHFVPLTTYEPSLPFARANQANNLSRLFQPFVPSATTLTVTAIAGNTLTLSPQHLGDTLPANTVVVRRQTGSTYQYPLLANVFVNTTWTPYWAEFTMRPGTEDIAFMTSLSLSGGHTGFHGAEFWEGGTNARPKLHFTFDGSNPYTVAGVFGIQKRRIAGNHQGTIKVGQQGTHYVDANVLTRVITFKVADPVIIATSVGANTEYAATCATTGAEIRYTTNGSEPTATSSPYALGSTISFSSAVTVKWKAFRSNYNDSAVIVSPGAGVLPPPTFSHEPVASFTYPNDIEVIVTSPAGANLKILHSYANFLNTSGWQINAHESSGFTRYGGVNQNVIVSRPVPYGYDANVWRGSNDANSNADGGWHTANFPVDKTKTYRFSVWVKKTGGTSGRTYLGPKIDSVALASDSSSAPDGNPYFWWGFLPINEWHLIVGYVHPASNGSISTISSKVIRVDGVPFTQGNFADYKWLDTTTTTLQRSFMGYCNDNAVEHLFWNPRVEVVDSVNDSVDVLFAGITTAGAETKQLVGNSRNELIALSVAGSSSSVVASRKYTFQVAAPVISQRQGPTATQATLSAASATAPAMIHYTLNAIPPTTGHPQYTMPLAVESGTLTSWRGFRNDYLPSDITTYTPVVMTSLADADSDGRSDTQESADGTNPNDSTSFAPWIKLAGNFESYTFYGDTTYLITGPTGLYGATRMRGGAVIKFDTVNSPSITIAAGGTLHMETSDYHPVVFTTKLDNSVGASFGTGAPTRVGAPMLNYLGSGNFTLKNARFTFATTALAIGVQGAHTVRHVQFVDCGTAVSAMGDVNLQNVLGNNLTTFITGSGTVNAQHVTANGIGAFKTSSATVNLLNSILAGVTTIGTLSIDQANATAALSSDFMHVAQGNHYLPNWSSHRNAGSAAPPPDLAAELRKRTTSAPQLMTGGVSFDATLSPSDRDDDGVLDRGYHYAALDFVATGVASTASKLELRGGVALGVFGNNGITLNSGGDLDSLGAPEMLNRLVRCDTVQEQPITEGIQTGPKAFIVAGENSNLQMRFTEVTALASNHDHERVFARPDPSTAAFNLMFKDVIIRGAEVRIGAGPAVVTIQNNAFVDAIVDLERGAAGPSVAFHNNLVKNGYTRLAYGSGSAAWNVRDNSFDDTPLKATGWSDSMAGNNAYIDRPVVLGISAGESFFHSFTYEPGPFGEFYHASNAMIDNGSRTSSAAGLFHHLTHLAHGKDSGTVNIGFHYIAADSNGRAMDTDGDGLPDWSEDIDGNGTVDSGEASWLTSGRLAVEQSPPSLLIFTPLTILQQ